MKLNRRAFIASALSSASLVSNPTFASITGRDLEAGVFDVNLLPSEYGQTKLWSFNGTSPGTELRLSKGDQLNVSLLNNLPRATSIHWHGIRIRNAMDGVSGLTQDPVESGSTFEYSFEVPDAGTYWYHAHNRSFEQVARGLYGPLIVEEDDAPDVDQEHVLILDDWLIDPKTGQIADGFGSPHDFSHAGRLGNYISVNGTYEFSHEVRQHQRLRLRLINASNARIFELGMDGLEGWIMALDGMPLIRPQPFEGVIELAPAQRMDLFVDVTATVGEAGHIIRYDRDGGYSQAAFVVRGSGTASRRATPSPLPLNRHNMPDLTSARKLALSMDGGAMGSMRQAEVNGETVSTRQLFNQNMFWSFNGKILDMDAPPLAELSLGETVKLEIKNNTVFPHAMHLHGMHFHEMEADGSLGALRDTTLLQPREAKEIAFVADNPGKWLLHCHMLAHAASGMMTRLDVV